jgi:DNA-binding MarR family transcriptional regulator
MDRDWDVTSHNWVTPGEWGERLRFHDFPAFHLMSLAGLAKHAMAFKCLEPWNLSMPEWRLLSTVAEHSPLRLSRIAQLTVMDKAQVSRALRAAQEKGLVDTCLQQASDRTPAADARPASARLQVLLTAAGRAIYDKVMPLVQREQMLLIELMTHEERRVLLTITQRLFAALREELQEQPGAGSTEGSPR